MHGVYVELKKLNNISMFVEKNIIWYTFFYERKRVIIMKYRVMYKSTDYLYLDVEANSLEEAKEIAENTDSGEFVEDGAGDWEYDRTEDKDGNVLD